MLGQTGLTTYHPWCETQFRFSISIPDCAQVFPFFCGMEIYGCAHYFYMDNEFVMYLIILMMFPIMKFTRLEFHKIGMMVMCNYKWYRVPAVSRAASF